MFADISNFSIFLRRSSSDCLSQVETRIVVPGNSNLRVGKVVDLDILELAANEDKEQEPKVSGKYLITRLAHTLDRGTYRCSMILHLFALLFHHYIFT